MTRYTVNSSILLTDLPLLERPAAVRKAGFDAVEFWWPFPVAVPGDADISAFESAITDAGVSLTGLNFFAGDMPAGERGLVSSVARRREFADNIDVAIGIGERLGTTAFNALYGNRSDDASAEQQDEVALENLAAAATAAARIGAVVLLEPVSGTETYPIKTAAHALAVIAALREQGVTNVKLLADFYHLSVNGDDVDAVIAAYAADFGHVQIADAPGRGEPGSGDLPLARWIDTAAAGGYTGPVGLEYKATGDDPFAWLPAEHRSGA
ncbi:hydroxypyruvate isomerase [Tersicoccus phoenicis]|uniref:Hydroxypyruvate isomerase n=1 Tax=Tersicoccus phoenicis TaxID=554083 RepID=A0A1R1LJD5_9MICC|nr:TIM barrel protein [Tersicoccus phoenicis]OMH27653.1 hydroxypyruvate isomerase [Tersicoccus phoenicis]